MLVRLDRSTESSGAGLLDVETAEVGRPIRRPFGFGGVGATHLGSRFVHGHFLARRAATAHGTTHGAHRARASHDAGSWPLRGFSTALVGRAHDWSGLPSEWFPRWVGHPARSFSVFCPLALERSSSRTRYCPCTPSPDRSRGRVGHLEGLRWPNGARCSVRQAWTSADRPQEQRHPRFRREGQIQTRSTRRSIRP
jgi:hypothetical protein